MTLTPTGSPRDSAKKTSSRSAIGLSSAASAASSSRVSGTAPQFSAQAAECRRWIFSTSSSKRPKSALRTTMS